MQHVVFCTPEGEEKAQEVIHQLNLVGFTNKDISVIVPDASGKKFLAHEFSTKSEEGAAAGGGTGAIAGGILGWLAGIGALALPGIGHVAGPVMAALAGVAAGGTVGGLSGALLGLGFKEDDVNRYVGRIEEGRIMISVHTENAAEAAKAKDVFETAGLSEGACVKDTEQQEIIKKDIAA